MVSDTHVVDSLYPRVEKALSNRNNVTKLMSYIQGYMDRNNHILFDLNFSDRLVLTDDDQNIIFEITGIDKKEVANIISQSKFIAKLPWVSNPFTVLMAMAIRYFTIKRMKREAEVSIIYVTCLYYILLHTRSFRLGPPNREIMDYTLNKNPKVTNNFVIKREGTIFGLLRHTSMTYHNNKYSVLVGECTDVQLNDYLSAIRTRIGSNIKNLAKYFYEDHKANNYLNKDFDSYDEKNYHMADSTMLNIAKLSSKVSTNLVSYGFNKSFIMRSARMDNNVSPQKLTHILENVLERHRQDLDKFISAIIELYVIEGNNNFREISTLKFLAHSTNLYRTNSTRPKVIEIKEYLDKWMSDGSERHGNKFVRAATINAYRKCMFIAFVYEINKAAK